MEIEMLRYIIRANDPHKHLVVTPKSHEAIRRLAEKYDTTLIEATYRVIQAGVKAILEGKYEFTLLEKEK